MSYRSIDLSAVLSRPEGFADRAAVSVQRLRAELECGGSAAAFTRAVRRAPRASKAAAEPPHSNAKQRSELAQNRMVRPRVNGCSARGRREPLHRPLGRYKCIRRRVATSRRNPE